MVFDPCDVVMSALLRPRVGYVGCVHSADELLPGCHATAVPGWALADESPLGVARDVPERGTHLMEDGDAAVGALEVVEKVVFALWGGVLRASIRPSEKTGDAGLRHQRMPFVEHPSLVIIAWQKVRVALHPVLAPPFRRLAHGNQKRVGHRRARLLQDPTLIRPLVHGGARVVQGAPDAVEGMDPHRRGAEPCRFGAELGDSV